MKDIFDFESEDFDDEGAVGCSFSLSNADGRLAYYEKLGKIYDWDEIDNKFHGPEKAKADFELAEKYEENASGDSEDMHLAIFNYVKAAENGCAEAWYAIGEIYLYELGRTDDAIKAYSKGIEQGDFFNSARGLAGIYTTEEDYLDDDKREKCWNLFFSHASKLTNDILNGGNRIGEKDMCTSMVLFYLQYSNEELEIPDEWLAIIQQNAKGVIQTVIERPKSEEDMFLVPIFDELVSYLEDYF